MPQPPAKPQYHSQDANRLSAPLTVLLLAALWSAPLPAVDAPAAHLAVTDGLGQEVDVEVRPAQGDLLLLWLYELERDRPGFRGTLEVLEGAGIEVWLADPLAAAFLPRSNEHQRTLRGDSVAALLDAALTQSPKRILLMGHDRMALPLLRGLRQWQATGPGPSRLAGAVLLYPNLFGQNPIAGEEPGLDPVVEATHYPLLVLQPEAGSLRRRMGPVLEALWAGGAAAFVQLVPGVRDWYLLHETGADPAEAEATRQLPGQLRNAAALLAAAPRPAAPVAPPPAPAPVTTALRGLVQRPVATPPGFSLRDTQGRETRLADQLGAVTLVNFWATWCPPCVEEIPSMNALARHYDPADFRIVSINFQEGPEQVAAFLRQVDVDFPVLLDRNGDVSAEWRVFAFPSSFLLDREGRVRYSVNSAIPWDEPGVMAIIDGLLGRAGEG
jgi:thiol-disulfide isomerase/thioredoxin